MTLMKRVTALFLCFLMLGSGPLNAFATDVSGNDVVVETTDPTETEEVCGECGGSDGHTENCSFNTINTLNTETPAETSEEDDAVSCAECGQTEGHAEECSQYAAPVPVGCSECGQTEGHAEECSQYAAPAPIGCDECGQVEGHTEECSQYAASAPAGCVECGQAEGHTEGCSQYVDPNACAECKQVEGHLETCSFYEAPIEEVTEITGPQVGDKIWIKKGSNVYKVQSDEMGWALLGNYEVEIVNIITDESGAAIWYEFKFTSLGIGEFLLHDYKYVQVENTSIEEPEASEPADKNACSCGENAPENIADHADSCPRKQYIKTLFESKSAEEIYAQWETYDEATQTDLLNMLQKWDNTKYEDLKNLVDDAPDGEKETTVGGIGLKVQGVPEDVTLGAKTVAPKSWNEDVFDAVGSKKVVFAIDITLTGEDDLWQPADGKSVTVTLDAASLGLSEGERIGILHDHDGALNDLGICTVTDGKLTFTTNGFSVFYGYTVDFEYDGTWHSMSGGGYMYLSELFATLNIDRSVNTVTSVSFSNTELITLTHLTYIKEEGGGQDWRLISLAPFDTEEILTVSFSDGKKLEINVYDKAWGTENIDGNETWNNGDTHSNRKVTVSSTITINSGASVTLDGTITIPEGKTLTIACNGNATLKRGANNKGDIPLFQVDGGKLIIKSTGGTITVDGGKIAVARAAFVVGISSYEAYKKNNDNGGSTLELTNVTIKDCYSDGDGYGGAINFVGGNSNYRPLHLLTMNNCVVENCRAPHGSAIYFRGNSMGRATVKNTVFKNCVTYGKTELDGDDQGGTIRTNGQNGSIVIFEQCIFENNRSGYSDLNTIRSNARCYGGAIYWNSAGTTSTNSGHNDPIDSSNTRAKMYIYDCQIIDNKTSNRGGGIFNEAAMYIGTKYTEGFTTARVTNTYEIKGTLISGNTANGYTGTGSNGNCGGGVMVPSYGGGAGESKDMDVSLKMGKGVYITNNRSRHGGGFAMQINQTEDKNEGVTFSVDYDGAVIKNNAANENGGGIYIIMLTDLYKSNLNLVSGTIANNQANNGGGIYVENTNINIGTSATTADNAIKIEGNTAVGDGGGIYLKQETANVSSVLINVSNGFVTGNTATGNGGGIYQTGVIGNCVVTGEGKIDNNTAANGGGIYIAGGGKLSVIGGIITDNHAVGSSDAATAKLAARGVGGGIYVQAGEFRMSGDYVGLHSNDASVAANDAYATGGTATTLTLPDVENMNLAGWSGTGQPEGWFADYKAGDTDYPSEVIKVDDKATTNPGRYNYYDEDKVEVDYTNVLSTYKNTYYCLTIGTPHPGYGNLWITKTLSAPAKENQTFIFEVTGMTRKPVASYSLTVTLVIEKGKTTAQALVANIPDGTYTVTEKEAWSWRYNQKTRTFQPKDGAVIDETTFTVAIENPEWIANFTNAREKIYWLSGDSYCENWWGGTSGTKVEKREEHE